jgi:phage recombination protein Bet
MRAYVIRSGILKTRDSNLQEQSYFMDTNTLNSNSTREKKIIKSEEAQLIREMSAVGATESEFKAFLYLCEEYDLDPLKKEIYFIKYAGKSTILTSRDGYLKIANLNKNFDGLESDVVYQGDKLIKREDGSLHIEYGEAHLAFDKSKLTGAYCNVFRKDRRKATAVFVNVRDYYKRGAPIWEQYVNAMILKVAESMALKRAFAISGLVTREEIEDKEFELESEK